MPWTKMGNMDVLPAVPAFQALLASLSLLGHCSDMPYVSREILNQAKSHNTLASSSASGICLSASFV